jgi:hypothetical protein
MASRCSGDRDAFCAARVSTASASARIWPSIAPIEREVFGMECKASWISEIRLGNGQQVLARSERLRQRADFALDDRPAFGHVAQRFLAGQHTDQAPSELLDLGTQRRPSEFSTRDATRPSSRVNAVEAVGEIGRRQSAPLGHQPLHILSDRRELLRDGRGHFAIQFLAQADDFLMKACRRSGRRTAGERFLACADGGNVLAGFLGARSARADTHFLLEAGQGVIEHIQRRVGGTRGSGVLC